MFDSCVFYLDARRIHDFSHNLGREDRAFVGCECFGHLYVLCKHLHGLELGLRISGLVS